MTQRLVLLDANSLGYFAHSGQRLSIGSFEVHAIYNFLRSLRSLVALYQNHRIIAIWDGAPWRLMSFPDYKANRDRGEASYEKDRLEARKAYKKQVPYIRSALEMLGIAQISAANMEADDMAAILVDRYKDAQIVLVSRDEDWLQLVGPNVYWRDLGTDGRIVTTKNFADQTGFATAQQFIEGKALMGDMGDNVPGVGGIGKKGAQSFLATYGSFANFVNQVCLEKTVKFDALPKKFKALIEDEEKVIKFQRNLGLVDLRTPMRPAPVGLIMNHKAPDLERFRAFCERLLFKSITQDFELWLSVFPHLNMEQV